MMQQVSSRASAPIRSSIWASSLTSPRLIASPQVSERSGSCCVRCRFSIAIRKFNSGASMAAGKTRFAIAGFETMTPRAPLWVRTCRLSSAVLVEKAGTVIAPTDMMARSQTSHSGRFSAISATRSPGLTPRAIRPRASARTSAATCAQRIALKRRAILAPQERLRAQLVRLVEEQPRQAGDRIVVH